MRFNATWQGPHPAPGDVLMARERPRYGYVIERVVRVTKRGRLILEVDRYPVDRLPELPPTARVHLWTWAPRVRAAARRADR